MELVARLGDGHTELDPSLRRPFMRWFPLRMDHFAIIRHPDTQGARTSSARGWTRCRFN